MTRELAIPPDARARHEMLKEACKNPPTTDKTLEDRQPHNHPPQDLDDAALVTDEQGEPRSA